MLRVIFAPDWRRGVPYQELLSRELEACGVKVDYLQHYRRVLPLSRSLSQLQYDILHLHWPEAYYPRRGDGWDFFRNGRFTLDLALATRSVALVTTAHNLVAHNRASESFARYNMRGVFRRSGTVFCHSIAAKERLKHVYGIDAEKLHVIPHGDLSVNLPRLLPRQEARHCLKLQGEPIVLMFGTVEPYKGIEEVIGWWRVARPDAMLVIAGRPLNEAYAREVMALAAGADGILCHLRWLADEELHQWLSAADAALFNYPQIFTSGAAQLARSMGIPILVPRRLDTLDLGEPSPYVVRFASLAGDFTARLAAALSQAPDYEAAKNWRESCSWSRVAKLTLEGYMGALEREGRAAKQPAPRPASWRRT